MDVSAGEDHLPNRGDGRDPLSSRRGISHRRHLWLCCSPAKSTTREAAGFCVYLRRHPQDPRSQTRSRPDFLRSSSRYRGSAHSRPCRRARVQSTHHHANSRHDPLGASVGAADRADRLAGELAATVGFARKRAAQLRMKPKVYFEQWDEPMISGIGWVSELIEAAGGVDVFADRASCKSAKDRIVTAEEVIRNKPDIIIGSWCGKKFRPEKLAKRPGFDRIPAVKRSALHEIKSPLILQPGPAALTDGLAALQAIIADTISRKTVAVRQR